MGWGWGVNGEREEEGGRVLGEEKWRWMGMGL